MHDEDRKLLDRWILTFLEPPPVVDPELMRRLLAEHDAKTEDAMTEKTFKAGDTVRWDHSQGSSKGEVVRKLTRPTKIKGHKIAASKSEPEYLVESDKTGARAAHKPEALRKA